MKKKTKQPSVTDEPRGSIAVLWCCITCPRKNLHDAREPSAKSQCPICHLYAVAVLPWSGYPKKRNIPS